MNGKQKEDILVLLDGSAYLYRAYHALPPLKNTKYLATGWIEYPEKHIKNASLGDQMVLKEMDLKRKNNDS